MSTLYDGIQWPFRCYHCGKFVRIEPGVAWEAYGEFGEDTRYICKPCTKAPNFKPTASNGSSDPRWCGFIRE